MLKVTWCLPFRVLCAVRTQLLVVPLHVIVRPIICFEGTESLYTKRAHVRTPACLADL